MNRGKLPGSGSLLDIDWNEGQGKLTPGLIRMRAAGGLSFPEVRHKQGEKLKNSQITKLRCPVPGQGGAGAVWTGEGEAGRTQDQEDLVEKTQRSPFPAACSWASPSFSLILSFPHLRKWGLMVMGELSLW